MGGGVGGGPHCCGAHCGGPYGGGGPYCGGGPCGLHRVWRGRPAWAAVAHRSQLCWTGVGLAGRFGDGASCGCGHFDGRGVSLGGLFGQPRLDHPVQSGRDGVLRLGGSWWWRDHVAHRDLLEGIAGERRLTCEALIEHAGERVNVGTGLDFAGLEAFRRHVGPSADGRPLGRQPRIVRGARDAEVDEVGEVVVGQQDVGRLDVAVHQPGPVGGVERRRDLLDDVHRAFGLQRAGSQERVQVDAVDEPHGDVEASVDLADVVDRHDVRVVESRGDAGFAAEPLVEVGVLGVVGKQHLQRHHAVDCGVVGAPHLAHPATAQQINQLVAAEWRPFHRLTIAACQWIRGRDSDVSDAADRSWTAALPAGSLRSRCRRTCSGTTVRRHSGRVGGEDC
jgi:hypothetical protein